MSSLKKGAHQNAIDRIRKRQETPTLSDLTAGIRTGDRACLSQAITLVESTLAEHHQLAQKLIENILPYSGKSFRLGITGVPGVGKSSFIEAFGRLLIDKGHKVAVLAIDPSSQKSKGSILGDKTRMEWLSTQESAFIRPSPSSNTLGGVARKTRESILLCEAAGFDYILVETVGVGQSETEVKSMVDFFLLLMLAGAGDELQGIKRGIMEMAEAIIITKADGENIHMAKQARQNYKNALHLFPPNANQWIPKVLTCSSITGDGLPDLYNCLESYQNQQKINGYLEQNRSDQNLHWMHQCIEQELKNLFFNHPDIQAKLDLLSKEVSKGKIGAFQAAEILLKKFKT